MKRMVLVAIAATLITGSPRLRVRVIAHAGRQAFIRGKRRHALEPGCTKRDLGRPSARQLEVLNRLVHVAIYDAVASRLRANTSRSRSIRRSADLRRRGRGGGRPRCACGARARASLDRRGELRRIPRRHSDGTRKTNGIRLGRAVVSAYLALRSDDGFDNVCRGVQPTPGPGVFEPIPPGSTPVDVKLKQVRPLSFDNPTCTSARTARIPSRAPTTGGLQRRERPRAGGRLPLRTTEQTEIALFWSGRR